jgi:thiamine biosynthesis lipoprotein
VPVEHRAAFDCFGGRCTVVVSDRGRPLDAAHAAAEAKRSLLDWHRRFSRFDPNSELMHFNRDTSTEIEVTPMMARLIAAAIAAARETGGLVDATLGTEIVEVGYAGHYDPHNSIELEQALANAPRRASAGAAPVPIDDRLYLDPERAIVTRRGKTTQFDPGGIAKGVFADALAERLAGFDAFAADCAGDLRVGGAAGWPRPVQVAGAFAPETLHTFSIPAGGVATSGIGRRSWTDPVGRPAHHLLDPRTGQPAFTGIVQATALAPSAAQAEALAKAAVLSGPDGAAAWLRHGGVIVTDDGRYEVLEPAAEPAPSRGVVLREPSARIGSASASRDSVAARGGTPRLGARRSSIQAQMSASTASRSGSLRIS